MAFSTFTLLYNHYCHPSLELFICPNWNSVPIKQDFTFHLKRPEIWTRILGSVCLVLFSLPYHNSRAFAVFSVWHLLSICCAHWYYPQKYTFSITLHQGPYPWPTTAGELVVWIMRLALSFYWSSCRMVTKFQVPEGECSLDILPIPQTHSLKSNSKRREVEALFFPAPESQPAPQFVVLFFL